MIPLLMTLACAPKPPAAIDVPVVDPGTQPILPASMAPVYATGHALPKDELVAQVALGLAWDESLSGAAAALALSDQALGIERAQYAAFRAGYPYLVRIVSSGSVPAGTHPDALVRTLHTVMNKTDRLGLARVRSDAVDRWVALVSSPNGALEPFEREQALGAELTLSMDVPGTWMAVSPSGRVQSGPVPGAVSLDEEGEWWLELDGIDRTVSALPVYVGMPTPTGTVIELPGDEFAGPVEAADEAMLLVSDVREAFSMARLRDDGTLETLAQYPLNLLLSNDWDRESGEVRLQGAGFTGGPVGQIQCQGTTVATCVDSMLRSGRERAILLNPSFRIGGAAAQVSTNGVAIVVNMATE
ncbi:MAG: hypothetical protein VX944_10910 [Myxococcota bacterium]|nr:hypothetical protein [Myxococcota bacterium]MEC9390573.1 hypothetical protein [Myxococcota bacterium]